MNETISRAAHAIWSSARVLEQRRFEHRHLGGDAASVLDALAPYRTADGGYGYALEPDGRGPVSQPPHVWAALEVLEELDAVDPAICDHLETLTAPDGGLPLALPSLEPYPRAPWWGIEPGGSLIATAQVLSRLKGVEHPWVDRATAFCREKVEALEKTHPYEAEAAVVFLDFVGDAAGAARVGELVREQGLIGHAPEGYAAEEVHHAYDFAPRPDSLARAWFTDAEMDAALEQLESQQGEDGGWHPNWLIWTPAIGSEWIGVLTLRALKILESYGRLDRARTRRESRPLGDSPS
jgi:hypothetical protein